MEVEGGAEVRGREDGGADDDAAGGEVGITEVDGRN